MLPPPSEEGFTLGWTFTSSEAIHVTHLGIYMDPFVGLMDDHKITIWDTQRQVLAEATVLSNAPLAVQDGDPSENSYQYVKLSTPLVLQTNQEYIITAYYPSSHDGFLVNVYDPPASPLTYTSGREGIGDQFPQFPSPNAIIGPNFKFDFPSSNTAPTDVALSNSTVAENRPAGTTVGMLGTLDPDAGDTHTYSLVGGDVAAFSIVGNELRTNAVFDFETKNSYGVTIRSTDGGGLFHDETFTIHVSNVENADLSGLSLSPGTLSPAFGAGTMSYTASVGHAVNSVTVTPTAADGYATVYVDGMAVASGSPSSARFLQVGANTIMVSVASESGATTKTYALTVTRAASSNADLSNLTLSAGTLAPTFATGTTEYTATVASGVSSITVTPTLADAFATVMVDGVAMVSGNPSAPITLQTGVNTIKVDVTAQDGSAKTYEIVVTRPADLSGNVTAAEPNEPNEPATIPTTADTPAESVALLSFNIADGGGGDGLALGVSNLRVHTSGTADAGKLTYLLTGPDVEGVVGIHGDDIVFFGELHLSIADGASEVYTVRAFWNDNTGLVEGQTVVLSTDGDTDFAVAEGGTGMGATTAVANGTGATVEVTATQLVFTTEPAGSVSGSALTQQPRVAARDAFGNLDADFAETVTLTEASAGTLTNHTATATSGVATFTDLTYLATADQQAFTLTADDESGTGSDLPPVAAGEITADVVATQLSFQAQPAPTTLQNGTPTGFWTEPVVAAVDGHGVLDVDYAGNITLAAANGPGTAKLAGPGDIDGDPGTVTLPPLAGTAFFGGLQATYTALGTSNETFNLSATSGALTPTTSTPITVLVNQAPTFDAGATATLAANEDGGAVSLTDPLAATDTDAGNTLTWSVTAAPEKGTLAGFPTEATADGGSVTPGDLTYTPSADATGADQFTIQVSDGTATDEITVDVAINARPTATITSDETSPTRTAPFDVAVTFSEAVTGFAVSDVAVTGGTATSVTGSGAAYTVRITPAGDGAVTVNVPAGAVVDGAAAPNEAAAPFAIVYDGTAPAGHTATFVPVVVNAAGAEAVAFAFAGAEVGTAYHYTITSDGGGTSVTGTGTVTAADGQHTGLDVRGLGDGTLTLSVTLTDAAGNTSEPVTDTVDKDAALPSAPSAPDLAAGSDSGASDSDDLTNDATPTLTGTAEAHATVALTSSLDGPLGTSVADEAGAWSFTGSTTLSEGLHIITATAADAAGNASPASASLTVVLDITAPGIPAIPDLADASDTGASSTDDITSVTTPTFTGTAEAHAVVTLTSDADGTLATVTADDAGHWHATAQAVSDGAHAVTVTVTDAAGNSTSSAALTMTVDSAAPSAPSTPDLLATSDSGASDSDDLTNDATPTLTGTAEAHATVALTSSLDGPLGTSVADEAGAWSFTGSTALSEGMHAITATATDAAGQSSAASTNLHIVIDTHAPSVPSALDLAASSDSGASSSDDLTNDATPTLTGTAEAHATVALTSSLDGPLGTSVADETGAWTFAPTAALGEGVHDISATAVDGAGNTSPASAGLTVVLDITAPDVPALPDLATSSDDGFSTHDDLTSDTTPTLTGTAEAHATIALTSSLDGPLGTSVADEAGAWSFTGSAALSEGTHAVTSTTTDAAGNVSPTSAPLALTITDLAPAFTGLAGGIIAFTEGDAPAVLDPEGDATVLDADNVHFGTGTLTASITAGAETTEDVLAVAPGGDIAVSGTGLTYQGTPIATFTGGTGGADLAVTFNASATPEAVQALLRRLAYHNTNGDAPSDAERTVVLTLADGTGLSTPAADIAVHVTPTNDRPLLTELGDGALAYSEGDPATAITPALTLSDQDHADLASATVTITAGYAPGEDVLAVPSQGGITASFDGATGVLTFTGTASVAAYEAALRAVTYENTNTDDPAADARTIQFEVHDGDQPSLPATRTVAFTAINDAPTHSAIADRQTLEDTPTEAIGFTIGDAETDPADLTVTATSSDTTVVPNAGLTLGGSDAHRTLTVAPAPDAFGTATISVVVSDGTTHTTGTFVLDVTPVNDAPGFVQGADQEVMEDAGAQVVSGWATEISAGPANETEQTLTFTLTTDHDALFDERPALSKDGRLSYTPAANTHGAATVTVRLADDGGTEHGGLDAAAVQTFTITVKADDDAPTLSAIADQTTLEDTPAGPLTFTVSDVESPAEALLVSATTSDTALVPASSFVFEGTGEQQTLTVIPAADAFGTATITLTAYDGAMEYTTSFALTVLPVNDAPTALADTVATAEDTPVVLDVLANDTDIDGDVLHFDAIVTPPQHGTATVLDDSTGAGGTGGRIRYTPQPGFDGEDRFVYAVTDSSGARAEAEVHVVVRYVNDAPQAQADTVFVLEDTSVSIDVSANDTDEDHNQVRLAIVTAPDHGTVEIVGRAASGTFRDDRIRYTPAADYHGTDRFVYRVIDADSAWSEAVVHLTIAPVNDPPRFADSDTSAVFIEPAEGETVVLDATADAFGVAPGAAGAAVLTVRWHPASDPEGNAIRYRWRLSETADFAAPLLEIDAGTKTSVETDHATLVRLLASAGVEAGTATTFYHQVIARDDSLEMASRAVPLTFVWGTAVSVEDAALPTDFTLAQNYPNPFNPVTTIRYGVPRTEAVRLEIYDLTGRMVRVLVDRTQEAGWHTVQFDAGDLASGTYLYRLQAGRFREARTLVLVK